MDETTGSARRILSSFLLRSSALALTWMILTEGDLSSLRLGVPIVVIAGLVSIPLAPPQATGFRVIGVLPYATYFVKNSIAGGFDVARRALSPAMPIDPGFVDYRLHLTGTAPRVIFANTISLLPGTLSARLIGDSLQVHALDVTTSVEADLHELETIVGTLFGQRIPGGERT
ncbi:MAG: Na+/H+ antiporter subunit E [Coriobacteriia bacterium]|nr:Na+/H+ antiporter subunit E [Coriobacteriia bacterium]